MLQKIKTREWLISLAIIAIVFLLVILFTQTNFSSINLSGANKCLIKGNINKDNKKVYHLPECSNYDSITVNPNKGEGWFCTEEEAIKAGWEKSKNCP